jgi:hypothetical protein
MTYRRILAELVDLKRELDSVGSEQCTKNNEYWFRLYNDIDNALSAWIDSVSKNTPEKESVDE